QPWLIAVAVVCVLAAAAGLVFEYYTGPEKH
ncbi:cytochrome C oxidase subunit IV, partial [Rhodococcus erythropolis]